MNPTKDIALTALAPAIWGTTYIVSTELLAGWPPLVVAFLRALPAGLLLLLLVRQLPTGNWWWRVLVLGALNFSIFWVLLFYSAYELTGGVAATVGAVQPLLVLLLSSLWLNSALSAFSIGASLLGIIGVALLVLNGAASLSISGIVAGLGGALSMAAGTVLSKRWQPPVSMLTFTAWQLTAGGLLLLPIALLTAPAIPAVTPPNLLGLTYLGLIGAAATYVIWFRGIASLSPASVSFLGFLSPATAVLLGWLALGETLTLAQITGIALTFFGIALGQYSQRRALKLKTV